MSANGVRHGRGTLTFHNGYILNGRWEFDGLTGDNSVVTLGKLVRGTFPANPVPFAVTNAAVAKLYIFFI